MSVARFDTIISQLTTDYSVQDFEKVIQDFEKQDQVSFLHFAICHINHKLETGTYDQKTKQLCEKLHAIFAQKVTKKLPQDCLKKPTIPAAETPKVAPVFSSTRGLSHIQLKRPSSCLEKVWSYITFIPRVLFAIVIDTIASSIFLMVGFLFGSSNWNTKDYDPNKPTIIGIHGKGSNWTTWFLPHLLFKKYANIFSYNLEDKLLFSNGHTTSIEDYAEKLLQKIQKIQKTTGVKKIHLWAHSMGGPVAMALERKLLQKMRGKISVESMTFLTSPLYGSPVTYLQPWNRVARDLRTGSPYLKELRDSLEERVMKGLVKVTIIRALIDFLVPPQYSVLKGAKVIDRRWFGHVGTALMAPFFDLWKIVADMCKEHDPATEESSTSSARPHKADKGHKVEESKSVPRKKEEVGKLTKSEFVPAALYSQGSQLGG
ncbi:MAG: alpha/beta hydrolase [Chlamydiota bacterium]